MKTKVNTNEQSTNDEESNNTKNKFVTIKMKTKHLSKKEKRKIICKKYREKKKLYVIELEREYSNLQSQLLSLKNQLLSLKNQTDFCSKNDLLLLISSHLNNRSYSSFFFPSFQLNTKDDLLNYLNFIQNQRIFLSNCFFSSSIDKTLLKEMIMISFIIEKLLISIVIFLNGVSNIDTYN